MSPATWVTYDPKRPDCPERGGSEWGWRWQSGSAATARRAKPQRERRLYKDWIMEQIDIGIRIRAHDGISFFGTEEVNKRINQGARVVAIEPAGVILGKSAEDGEKVSLTLGGCKITVYLSAESRLGG